MAQFRVLDGHVISEAEYLSRASDIVSHLNARQSAEPVRLQPLMLSEGKALAAATPAAAPNPLASTPIGRNKPLSVYILHVYTGKYPERGVFGTRGDMAIVSGVKSFSAFDASSRALNYLQPQVVPGSHFISPVTFEFRPDRL